MNKIVEYMAMSRPLVSFDLIEARVSAGEAALYATPNDEREFARLIAELLDDPERRARMGAVGRRARRAGAVLGALAPRAARRLRDAARARRRAAQRTRASSRAALRRCRLQPERCGQPPTMHDAGAS